MTAPSSTTGAASERPTGADPLALYCVILAMTTLVHRTVIPNWITALKVPTGWLTVIAAVWLLFRPGSTRAFVFFVLAAIGEWLRLMPFMPNHFFFEGLMSATVLCALWRRWRRDRGAPGGIDRAQLLSDFAPIVRAELLVMYAFTVLHKLNSSFLDPQVSCAVKMHRELAEVLPGLPSGPTTDWPVIVMTLAFEAGIPLLLAFRRTVYWGIGAGLFFHALLAIHPHAGVSSFSAMLYALYFLFLPPEAVQALAAFWERSGRAWRKVLPSISPKAVAVLVFVLTLAAQVRLSIANIWYRTLVAEVTRIAFWPGAVWGVWLALSYVCAMQAAKLVGSRGSTLRFAPHPGWLVMPLLVFNGFCPYLGLKTVTVFSMFSNLRTESEPNHLFMPQLHLTGLQTDQVQIVSSSHQGTASECEPISGGMWCSFPGERVPYLELRRWTSNMRTFEGERLRVSFVRGGRRHELAPDGDPALRAELYTPPPFWLSKLMLLRIIQEPSGPTACRW
jgi:hypothetical protein